MNFFPSLFFWIKCTEHALVCESSEIMSSRKTYGFRRHDNDISFNYYD